MRVVRTVLWLGVAAAAIAYAFLLVGQGYMDGPKTAQGPVAELGGEFSLTDQQGKPFTRENVAGAPHAVFFGFTHCPDVCPTTLFTLSELMKQLGGDADRLRVLFVTVDPERDTVGQLSTYMSSFDPRITALTGDTTAVDRMVRNFKAYSRKVPTANGDYTMDHTSLVFLMAGDGRFVGTLDQHEAADVQLAKLKRLLKAG